MGNAPILPWQYTSGPAFCWGTMRFSNCGRGLAHDSGGAATGKLTVPPPSGASPLPQIVVCGLGRHGQCAHLAVAIHQWPGVLLGHDEVLKLWEGACPR